MMDTTLFSGNECDLSGRKRDGEITVSWREKNELSTERRHVDVNVCPETLYLFWLPKLKAFVYEFSMI